MKKLLLLLAIPLMLASCSRSGNELVKNVSVTGTMWSQSESIPGFGTGSVIVNFINDNQCEITIVSLGKRAVSNLYEYAINEDRIVFTPREGNSTMTSEGIIKNDDVLQYRLFNPAPDAKQSDFIELKRVK